MTQTTIALIPAYNPSWILVKIAAKLAENQLEVLIVNDGSIIDSKVVFDAVKKYATVLEHEENKGKGEALKTGLRYVLNTYGDNCTIVTLDADGQHDIEDTLRVCAEARKRPQELTLGSRQFDGAVPLKSKIGNKLTRTIFKAISGVYVRDTQTGLRAFSGQLARKLLTVGGARYEYEMSVLMECARQNIPIHELDIRTIYINKNASSHFNPILDSARIYREILKSSAAPAGKFLKFSGASFVSFLIDYLLYCTLFATSGSAIVSNVVARAASATLNYSLNRKAVFESAVSLPKSLAQYAFLAACMLAVNTLVLNALVSLGANPYIAKIAIEFVLFVLSYNIQHSFIFGEENSSHEKKYLGDSI